MLGKMGILKSKEGRPRLLTRLLLYSTNENFVHQWVSGYMKKGDVVLDVGARKFPYTRYQKVKALYGIDLPSKTEGYLGWTDEYHKELLAQKNIFPILGSCEDMPFEDNYFDNAVMTEVLEHVEGDEQAISELARVLKKNGRLLITTPNGTEVANTNPHHIRHYRVSQLRKLLSKYFEEVEIQTKFPNQSLFIKQHLPKNQTLPKRLFWKYVYEAWHGAYGHKRPGGYSIVATCGNPRSAT